MDRFLQFAVTIGGWGIGLILLYLLLTHPTAVTSEFKAGSGFVVEESRVLQGR